ncbi:hypothetical protein EON65_18195 [archaeon]|nr:MAG: hypothetical protein EON65_18195 [archaeon]
MEDDKFDSDYATLERFFAKLQIALQENDVFGSGKSLLFSTDKWSWCFDASKKYTLHHWHKSEKSPIDCDTIITTNSSTLRALATGSLKPMHAYMSGRIKFSGDRGVLKMYAKAMKQAMVQDKKSADTKPAHTSAHYLDAHIVDTVIDKSRDKEVVKYVILVVNNHAQQSWKVQRRYSDFVKLQYALSKNSQPIRVIKSNNAMFVSKEKLVKERVGVLNEFLQHVTHNLPPHNIVVNSFLTNDQHSIYLWQQPQNEENSQEVPEHTAQEDIATHVFDHCLPYQSDNLARNTVILNEMAEMKQSLSQLKRLVFRDHASVIVSLLLVFRHLLCVYIAYCLLSVQLSNGDSDYFRVTWLQIKAHLYASSVVVYLLYTQSFSLLGAYLNMLCVPRVAHMIASMETELSVSRVCHTFFTSFVDSVHTIAATSLWKVSSLLFMHNTIDLCYILLCVIYVTVITFGICIYTKPRLQRGLEIYSMGLSLIFFYAFLSLVLYLLGYDEQQRTVVYNYVDQYVSSYITHQIKQYKSIFIKFAQYFGARSDVMSAVWSEKLSVLQDQCSESRGIYVKRCMQDMVRDMFGDVKVEDVFQDFDLNPVASASIAQVHFAVLNLRKLKELKCKNIGVDWDGHVKLLEDMCQKSHNNAEFSSHSKSSKDVVQYLLPVAVKVQHEDIDSIMIADMEAVLNLTILAARLDNRWQASNCVLSFRLILDDILLLFECRVW